MSMDKVLAEIYGTGGADLEKLAAAELAEGLAADGNMNMDNLSDADVESLAQQVLDDVNGQSQEEPQADAEDEVMAKVAEADKLGRVMAHSMVQELGYIKTAAGENHPESSQFSKQTIPEKAKEVVQNAKKAVTEGAAKAVEKAKGTRVGQHVAAHSVGYGRAAKATGAAGAAYGLHRAAKAMYGGKSKKSSALDTLAEARAMEILEQSGIDPSKLEAVQEKTSGADPAEVLGAAVDSRAWEILAQYGVVPQE